VVIEINLNVAKDGERVCSTKWPEKAVALPERTCVMPHGRPGMSDAGVTTPPHSSTLSSISAEEEKEVTLPPPLRNVRARAAFSPGSKAGGNIP
jgi:hypothetical protein